MDVPCVLQHEVNIGTEETTYLHSHTWKNRLASVSRMRKQDRCTQQSHRLLVLVHATPRQPQTRKQTTLLKSPRRRVSMLSVAEGKHTNVPSCLLPTSRYSSPRYLVSTCKQTTRTYLSIPTREYRVSHRSDRDATKQLTFSFVPRECRQHQSVIEDASDDIPQRLGSNRTRLRRGGRDDAWEIIEVWGKDKDEQHTDAWNVVHPPAGPFCPSPDICTGMFPGTTMQRSAVAPERFDKERKRWEPLSKGS
ncbi:hypothetical protein OH76DRAFT_906027 [Lentinus brumalis]|uniref:Uncharacterized protein n=1 Tax=Lentinus brumalis TaxID=2498619 RepID=A0A371D0G0_9APHY|nr:hypothetical protein OH76DRAFT_906027 [Polyporus brumalis]